MSLRNFKFSSFALYSSVFCIVVSAQSNVEILRHDLSTYPNGRLYPDTTLHGVEKGLIALDQACKAKSNETPQEYYSKTQALVTLYRYYGLPSGTKYIDSAHESASGKYAGVTYDSLTVTRALIVFEKANFNSPLAQIHYSNLYTAKGQICSGKLFTTLNTYVNLTAQYQSYNPTPKNWHTPSIEVIVFDSLPNQSLLPTKYRNSISYVDCLIDKDLEIFGLTGSYDLDLFTDSYFKRFVKATKKYNKTIFPKEKFSELKSHVKLERFNQAIDSAPFVAQAYYFALGEVINGNLGLTSEVSIRPDYLFMQLVNQRENFDHRLRTIQRAVSWPSCGGGNSTDGRMWYYRKPIAMLAGAIGKTQLFINAHFELLGNQISLIEPKRPNFAYGGYLDETSALGLDAPALVISHILEWQGHREFLVKKHNYKSSTILANSVDRLHYLNILYSLIEDKQLDLSNRFRAYYIAKQTIKNMRHIANTRSDAKIAEIKLAGLLPKLLNE